MPRKKGIKSIYPFKNVPNIFFDSEEPISNPPLVSGIGGDVVPAPSTLLPKVFPNLAPEKYGSFEYFNDGDDVGTVDDIGTGSFDVRAPASTDVDMYSAPQRNITRASDGRLWVTWEEGEQKIKVAYSDDGGETWTTEEVFDAVLKSVWWIVIALDSNDKPHVAFGTKNDVGSGRAIYYSNRVGGSWTTPSVVNGPTKPINGLGLAIDSNDKIHLAYGYGVLRGSYRDYTIYYETSTDDGDNWSGEESVYVHSWANNIDASVGGISLVTDSNDIPHLIFVRNSLDGTYNNQLLVTYINRVGGSWNSIETVSPLETGEGAGWGGYGIPNIVLGSDDVVHVAYSNFFGEAYGSGDQYRIFYSYRESASADWANNKETAIGNDTLDPRYFALTLNKVDTPYLFYTDTEIYITYRTDAVANWENNAAEVTSGLSGDMEGVQTIGATLPASDRFGGGSLFVFRRYIDGTDERITFYKGATAFYTAQASTAEAYEGLKSLKITGTGACYLGDSKTDYNVPVEGSTRYIFSVYIKSSAGIPAVDISIKLSDNASILAMGSTQVSTIWKRYDLTFNTNANTTGVEIILENEADGPIYYDCVQLERVNQGELASVASEFKAPSLTQRAFDDINDVVIT